MKAQQITKKSINSSGVFERLDGDSDNPQVNFYEIRRSSDAATMQDESNRMAMKGIEMIIVKGKVAFVTDCICIFDYKTNEIIMRFKRKE